MVSVIARPSADGIPFGQGHGVQDTPSPPMPGRRYCGKNVHKRGSILLSGEWEKGRRRPSCDLHAGEYRRGICAVSASRSEKGQKPAREEGSTPWARAACAWEPEHAWVVPPVRVSALQEPALSGCRCTKPIGRGDFKTSLPRASSRAPHEIGNRANRIVA